MELEGAIAYIRNWRESQNLDALSPQDEREAASKLLFEKGHSLPELLPDATGNLKLVEGVYVKAEEPTKVVLSAVNNEVDQPPETPVTASEVSPLPNLYPWNPSDKQEFWCEKLQSFVRMTGDLNADGTYYVNKSGDGTFRRWPVKGHELVPREQAPKEAPSSEFLLINSASWGDIKNCLINKFIPSYPWSKKGEKTPTQVREDMLALAKSRNKGLASFIDDERKQGKFEDPQNFVLRMNVVYESFPWGDFVQMLDFN